jgi:hypothetical protein
MPSLTVPIISNIKMKNSCRRILTRNALTPPPSAPPSIGQIETELKVKSYFYLFILTVFLLDNKIEILHI